MTAECPILAAFLSLRPGWEWKLSVLHPCGFFLSQGWEATNPLCKKEPHRDLR